MIRGKRISKLPSASQLIDQDLFTLVQDGVNKKVTVSDMKAVFNGGVEKQYVDNQDTKVLTDAKAYTDEQKEKLENLIVTTTSNPLGGYVCDYSSDEIRNALIQNKTVVMYFEDTVEQSGNQVYPFLKMTQDGAYFRRLQVDKSKNIVRQIDIKVDYSKKVTFEESKINVATNDELVKLSNTLQDLDHDKLGIKRVAVASDVVSQSEASDIISNYGNYEGSYIEFLTNGDIPSKTIGYGYLVTDKTGNQFLIVYNLDGTITQFNKSTYEKHMIECRSYVNEMVDLDNFTVDKQGDAPFYASVNDAINRPFRSETSASGIVFVMPFKIDKQVQWYFDVENQKSYTRYVTGTDGQHSFQPWQNTEGNGELYVLPQATESTLGGVKAQTATSDFTEPVGIKEDGSLVVKKQTGGGDTSSNVIYHHRIITQKDQVGRINIDFPDIPIERVQSIRVEILNRSLETYKVGLESWAFIETVQQSDCLILIDLLKVSDGYQSFVTLKSYPNNRNFKTIAALPLRRLRIFISGLIANFTARVTVVEVI